MFCPTSIIFFTRHTFFIWRTYFFWVTFQTIICKQTSVMNHLLFSLFSSTSYLWQSSSLQRFLLEVASNILFLFLIFFFFFFFKKKKKKKKERVTSQDTICSSNIYCRKYIWSHMGFQMWTETCKKRLVPSFSPSSLEFVFTTWIFLNCLLTWIVPANQNYVPLSIKSKLHKF